jgi:hypothetical protein
MDRVVQAEKNLRLFLNTRATSVEMKDKETIDAVLAVHVKTGQRYRFKAPLFVDCTGHGWIGYYAGAEFMMGQEARSQFNESMAPETARKFTQGNSLNNATFRTHKQTVDFNCPPWVYQWTKSSDFEKLGSHARLNDPVRPPNFDVPSRGKGRNPGNHGNGTASGVWWVEYGGIANTIDDAERIRDELFRVCLGLWNYAKNHNPETREQNRCREMVWLNYVPGSETGHDAAVPFLHYFEGMLSLGPYRVPDAGRKTQQIWDEVPERVAKFQLGEKYRLPLWELVYHDCVVAQWYWGDYNNKLPSLWNKRDLFNALYGTPPMFMFNRKLWEQNRDRFAQSYRAATPVARATGYSEMTDHWFLTTDRSVQQTRFANGVTVTVNFGDTPYRGADGAVVSPQNFRVTPDLPK